MELAIDPELRDLLPAVYSDELEKDIGPEGPRDPILVWQRDEEGPPVIVDGHRRYSVCERKKLPYQVRYLEFADKEEVCRWMIAQQGVRRNWTAQQRAEAIVRLQHVIEQKKIDQGKAAGDETARRGIVSDATKEVADLFGVTERTVYRGKKLATAFARLEPEVAAAIKKRTLAAANNDILELANLGHDEQKAVIDSVVTGEFRTLKEALIGEGAEYENEKPAGKGKPKKAKPLAECFDLAFHHLGLTKKALADAANAKPGADYQLTVDILNKADRRIMQWRDEE